MDVIWLKRDVRLHDHGPFAEVARSTKPFLILYLWEPDQLAEPTVHGSHLKFIHEGLVDLDTRLSSGSSGCSSSEQGDSNIDGSSSSSFKSITVCHNTLIETLEEIHNNPHYKIGRLLAHEETGHWQSFMRDKAARKWCRKNSIPFIEFNQTGVTRCLKQRDDYLKKFKAVMAKPRWATPNVVELQKRLIVLNNTQVLSKTMPSTQLDLNEFTEMPEEHRVDRRQRQQRGGETAALSTMDSFLQERGSTYSLGISSPNTSWTSCSRLSTYLSWGHISLRYAIHKLQERQDYLRNKKKQGDNIGPWLRSLQAFSSRLHWRSHFIQKLESEPLLEKQDLCQAYQPLRRQEGDWNEQYYQAWRTGRTGFPFVDACMRCLEEHGWLNFRMRAMVVSFACYNLWLDWKRLAPHLARVFLDYEPGIHYPQLQMQSGCTGINAMRVYSVTKQSRDQDPKGIFIRKYVPELKKVPTEYIHEPWKMPPSLQKQYQTFIGANVTSPILKEAYDKSFYPAPIVNEQESARIAKTKVADVRKLEYTKQLAQQVYHKHGSRNPRRDEMNGKKPKALSNVVEKEDPTKQPKISSMFQTRACKNEEIRKIDVNPSLETVSDEAKQTGSLNQQQLSQTLSTVGGNTSIIKANDPSKLEVLCVDEGSDESHKFTGKRKQLSINEVYGSGMHQSDAKKHKTAFPSSPAQSGLWSCKACTFINDKPLGLACSICATPRSY